MTPLNNISQHPLFQESRLYHSFKEMPLGFIDVGAAGGIHPLIAGAASLVHCVCFEPEAGAAKALRSRYEKENPFAAMTIFETAVSGRAGQRTIYVTNSTVNTSLLPPEESLSRRYGLTGFQVETELAVETQCLDDLVLHQEKDKARFGEFIKLDCQGAEYEILRGAEKILDEHCIALLCEVEFVPMYKRQKMFPDIDLFLRRRGFQLYGLSPHYISGKHLDRRTHETEERLLWADALYFKDPLDGVGAKPFDDRKIKALVLVALLTRHYDFALELTKSFFSEEQDRRCMKGLIDELSNEGRQTIESGTARLMEECRKHPDHTYLLAKKFIDRHRSNNNVDFINPDKEIYHSGGKNISI
jgi:FkbM family methyltransferase